MEDGFERAVAVTGDPSATEAARAAALAFFDSVCQHPDGWRFCLEKFLAAQTDDVRFCCLQLLQLELERGRLGPAAACVIRESLVSASVTVLPRARCGPAVLNKCAQLLVRAACLLPPAEWPAFIDQLLAPAAACESALDLLLRFLACFQDDVVDRPPSSCIYTSANSSSGAEYATAVKDALRERTTAQLAQLWLAVLDAFTDTRPALVHAVLALVARYAAWIPAPLLAGEPFLQRLLQLLQDARYAEGACACLAAVVAKGAEPAARLALVVRLRVADIAAAVPVNSTPSVRAAVARLLSTACEALLDAAERSTGSPDCAAAASALFDPILHPIAAALAHPDPDVSAAALPVLATFLTRHRGAFPGCAPRPEHLQCLLPVVFEKIAELSRENEDESDDDNSKDERDEMRQQFEQLFCAAVRINPETVLAFVEAAVASTCPSEESTAPSSPERTAAALHLLALFGDGVTSLRQQQLQRTKHRKRKAGTPPRQQETETNIESVLGRAQQLAVLATSRGLAARAWPTAVVLAFLECATQYSAVIAAVPTAVVPVLQAFLGADGVCSRNSALRNRATALLQRFLRSAGTLVAPHGATLVAGLLPALATEGIPPADRLSLYECLGAVLGARPPGAPALLRDVVAPLCAQLTPAHVPTGSASAALAALAVLSRGIALHDSTPADEALAQVFAETLPSAVALLSAAPRDPALWQQVATLVHRVIDALGAHVLPSLAQPLQQLCNTVAVVIVPSSSQQQQQQEQQQFFMYQLSELLSLVGQIVGRFHEHAAGVVEDVLAQTVTHCTAAGAQRAAQGACGSEEARELLELNRQFVQCLAVVAREAPALLLAPVLAPRLTDALRIVLAGAATPDVAHRRTSVRVLARLVDAWCARTPLPGFADFVAGTVVPELLRALVASPLAVTDGLVTQYIAELARLLVQAQAAVPAVCERLHGTLLSLVACECPESTAELFLVAVAAQETDVVSQGLKYFVQFHQSQHMQQQQQPPPPIPSQTPSPIPRPASL